MEVAVTYNLGEVQTAKVRPLSYDIPFQIDGNTVTFTLEHPRNLSVEVNGDIFIIFTYLQDLRKERFRTKIIRK